MTLSKKKLAVALVALVPLAGCGSLNPGVAATVGDTKISLDDIDSLAKGLCASNADAETTAARAQATTLKVRATLAADQMAGTGFEPSEADLSATLDQIEESLTGTLSDDELEEFLDFARESITGDQFVQAAAQQLLTSEGEEVTDESVGTVAGQLYAQWAEDEGVELDPRLGTWQDVQVVSGSGSLSVPVVQDAVSSQTCG